MKTEDHESHKWRYSDSSYYDFICEKCGVAEFTPAASQPCETTKKELYNGKRTIELRQS